VHNEINKDGPGSFVLTKRSFILIWMLKTVALVCG